MSGAQQPSLADVTPSPLMDQLIAEQRGRTDARQKLIKDIQSELQTRFLIEDVKLVTYITNFAMPNSQIQQPDISPIEDMLTKMKRSKNLFMMIDSPGGDSDIAQKIIKMCRNRCDCFYTIVPSEAKSAATMICLGSDKIFMGYLSELGPIDPQIQTPGGYWVSAQFFQDAYEKYAGKMRAAGTVGPYPEAVMLQQLQPAVLELCEKATKRTKKLTKEWLEKYMLRKRFQDDRANLEKISSYAKDTTEKLCDIGEWLLHSSGIDSQTAMKELNLVVEELKPDDQLWAKIWELYVLSERQLQTSMRTKLFESESISMNR